jgi:hypothetical protein
MIAAAAGGWACNVASGAMFAALRPRPEVLVVDGFEAGVVGLAGLDWFACPAEGDADGVEVGLFDGI